MQESGRRRSHHDVISQTEPYKLNQGACHPDTHPCTDLAGSPTQLLRTVSYTFSTCFHIVASDADRKEKVSVGLGQRSRGAQCCMRRLIYFLSIVL